MTIKRKTIKRKRTRKRKYTRRQRGGGGNNNKSTVPTNPYWNQNLKPFAEIKTVILPTGTLLYRSAYKGADWKHMYPKHKNTNTDKTGVYFSTYIFQALAMAIEYSVSQEKELEMELGIFQTTKPLTLYEGKYTSAIMPNGSFKTELSHFEADSLPIAEWIEHKPIAGSNELGSFIDTNYEKFIEYATYKLNEEGVHYGEVFLSTPEELASLKLLKLYTFTSDNLKRFMLKFAEENPDHTTIERSEKNDTPTGFPNQRIVINLPPDDNELFIRNVPLVEISTEIIPAGGAGY